MGRQRPLATRLAEVQNQTQQTQQTRQRSSRRSAVVLSVGQQAAAREIAIDDHCTAEGGRRCVLVALC